MNEEKWKRAKKNVNDISSIRFNCTKADFSFFWNTNNNISTTMCTAHTMCMLVLVRVLANQLCTHNSAQKYIARTTTTNNNFHLFAFFSLLPSRLYYDNFFFFCYFVCGTFFPTIFNVRVRGVGVVLVIVYVCYPFQFAEQRNNYNFQFECVCVQCCSLHLQTNRIESSHYDHKTTSEKMYKCHVKKSSKNCKKHKLRVNEGKRPVFSGNDTKAIQYKFSTNNTKSKWVRG